MHGVRGRVLHRLRVPPQSRQFDGENRTRLQEPVQSPHPQARFGRRLRGSRQWPRHLLEEANRRFPRSGRARRPGWHAPPGRAVTGAAGPPGWSRRPPNTPTSPRSRSPEPSGRSARTSFSWSARRTRYLHRPRAVQYCKRDAVWGRRWDGSRVGRAGAAWRRQQPSRRDGASPRAIPAEEDRCYRPSAPATSRPGLAPA